MNSSTRIKYILEKGNTTLITYNMELVEQFRKLGWKFKQSELSQLI